MAAWRSAGVDIGNRRCILYAGVGRRASYVRGDVRFGAVPARWVRAGVDGDMLACDSKSHTVQCLRLVPRDSVRVEDPRPARL